MGYRDQIHLTYTKWRGLFKPPLISCYLTFCSLSRNQISVGGACELAAALQVNQSLQGLEWVQPFMSYFLGVIHWYSSDGCVHSQLPMQYIRGFGWSYWNAWYSLASYPGFQWARERRAWYPLFAHALNFPEIYICTTMTFITCTYCYTVRHYLTNNGALLIEGETVILVMQHCLSCFHWTIIWRPVCFFSIPPTAPLIWAIIAPPI